MSSTLPIFRQVLRTRRRALIIWAVALLGICGMYTSLYPSMESFDMEAMLAAFPPAMIEALGYDDLGTAAGYVGSATYGLVALILLLVFGIGQGASILAGHEEDGALELELASPLPRSAVFTQRLGALWLQITLLVSVVFAVTLIIDAAMGLGLPRGKLSAATLQLWLVIGLFGTVAFAAGAATGRKGVALGVASALAVLSWMLNAIGPTIEFQWMVQVSPIGWYMDDNPITRGFRPVDAMLLAATSGLAIAAGWWRYRVRDLMT